MSNIRDVAKRAGVAPITVSRVINNSGYISRETRERVEAVVAELQYVPNSLARSLRFNQTKTIGLVVPDITNPFDTTIARGVEDVAHEHDFNVFLCNTDGAEEKQANYLTALLQKRVDGILLVPVRNSDQSVQPIQQQGVPVVVLDLRISYPYVDVVRGDSEGGAYQLVQFLLGLGHRQIAMLSGPVDMSTAVDRVAGYRRAMSEAGLESNEALIYLGAYSIDGGYDMMQQVLQKSLSPTAVFAGNNFIAVGAFRVLREAGLRVPDDVSLVAFDDLPITFSIDPFLTVVTQPPYDMGRRAAELLLARLSDQAAEYQDIILPTQIIVRRSSGPPRQQG